MLELVLTLHRYNDDEPAAKPAPTAQPNQYSAVQSAAPDIKDEEADDSGQHQDYGGGDSAPARYDDEIEEDDDDDIDFNLGNGPSTTVTHHEEKPTYTAPPAPAAPVKGPNAKEDG